MKTNLSKVLSAFLIVSAAIFGSGCVEHRYYREHHEHSPEYIQRHQPQPHVDVDIHN